MCLYSDEGIVLFFFYCFFFFIFMEHHCVYILTEQ